MFSLQPPAIGGSLSMPLYARGGGRQYLWVGSGNGRLYQLDLSGDPANPVVSSQILGDGGSAVGAPALDRTTNIVHVGTDAGAVYAVAVPF
jgi:hypothetical protein